MSKHLFGLIVTAHGTAANNRGETQGNITTLQKILWKGEVHTTVSAEAIRWVIRRYWQLALGERVVNRRWREPDDEKAAHEWADHEFKNWQRFIDDDVLGFMSAQAGRADGTEGGGRQRGTVRVRRGRLEVTRAISLTPFAGDITFNAASVGATLSASRTGTDPVLYCTEVHATRYQYGFALTPEDLSEPSRAMHVVDAIVNLSEVAGNQGRFLFDFAPDSVFFRWTDDFAPRILYGFELGEGGALSVPEVLRRVRAGDIDGEELIVGGSIAGSSSGAELRERHAFVVEGVKAAAIEVKRRMAADLA